jgi:hypothetical protein
MEYTSPTLLIENNNNDRQNTFDQDMETIDAAYGK